MQATGNVDRRNTWHIVPMLAEFHSFPTPAPFRFVKIGGEAPLLATEEAECESLGVSIPPSERGMSEQPTG